MSRDYIIHANIHRVKEAARVLEDVARFILKDKILFIKIKELRHKLITNYIINNNIEQDLGGTTYKENNVHKNLINVIQANASRMQEALRVLEESAENENEKHKIKILRFCSYQIQQEIYKKIRLYLKHDKLNGLYLIIDTDLIKLPLEEIINIINATSVSLVQLRNKSLTKQSFLYQAIQLKKLLDPEKLLIINDHLEIALDIADGVHLGQQDYPLERARKLMPEHFILGATCHNIEEAKIGADSGASYLSVGCLFPTQSKKNIISASLYELSKIRQQFHIPICAIGGINLQNISQVLSCKVSMIAILSAVWNEPNPIHAIKLIQEWIENLKSPLL